NTLGALLGAIAMERTRGLLARVQPRSSVAGVADATVYPVLVGAIVVALAAWQPFDVTLDVSTIAQKVRAVSSDPWQYSGLTDEAITFLQFALFALAACRWLVGPRQDVAALRAFVVCAVTAIGLEASQVLISSRMPGLEDAAVHVAGVATGVWLWR